MSKRLDFRLDDGTNENLTLLVAKTGKSKTEIVKDLINNARASDFKMISKSDEDIQREVNLIATRKYLILLYKNATTSLNQIAKMFNTVTKAFKKSNPEKYDNGVLISTKQALFNLKSAVDEMNKKVDKLTDKVKEADNND